MAPKIFSLFFNKEIFGAPKNQNLRDFGFLGSFEREVNFGLRECTIVATYR